VEERIAALQIQANEHERAIGELKGEVKAIPNLQASVDELTAAMNEARGMFKTLQIINAITLTGGAIVGWILGKKT